MVPSVETTAQINVPEAKSPIAITVLTVGWSTFRTLLPLKSNSSMDAGKLLLFTVNWSFARIWTHLEKCLLIVSIPAVLL